MTIVGLPVQTNQPVDNVTIGIAVLAKNLDTIRKAGQGMIKMMEQSVQPDVGQNFDYKL